MTVILMTQEAGARGEEIAARVANCLGIELVSRQHLECCIAHRLQVAEATVQRICKGNASLLERWMIDGRRSMAEEVMELAARGDVVVQTSRVTPLLRLVRHVICVHVCATGASWAAATLKVGMADADVRQDRSARAWLRRAPGNNKSAHLHPYDLVINSERIPVDQCVEQVRWLARCPQFQPTPASRAVLACLRLQARQRSTPDAAPEPPAREVIVNSSRVDLTGVTSNEQAIARIEDHLRGERLAGPPQARSLPPVGLFG
jgi:Cytidylate kinase-like family